MINKLVIVVLALISTGFAQAQSSNSPYSSFGLGDASTVDHAIYTGVGNNRINLITNWELNTYNPASMSYLRKQYPVFSIGTSSRFSTFTKNGVSEQSAYTTISEIAFGLSFAKHFGLSFGFKPYIRKGYDFSIQSPLGEDSVLHHYLGSGDVNRAFLGLSTNVLKIDSLDLQWTVGANLYSVFGSTNNERRSSLVSGAGYAGIEYNTLRMKAFQYELGTHFTKKFSQGHKIGLSAVIQPQQNLTAYSNRQLFSSTVINIEFPSAYSLIQETGEEKGTVTFAPQYTFGLNYTYKPFDPKSKESKRDYQLDFLASYTMADWTKFAYNFGDATTSNASPATSEMNFGVIFIPESRLDNSVNAKFFERVTYRAGYYTKTLPFSYNGSQMNEFGTTFGFGIPVLTQKVKSSFQMSFSYGKRSSSDAESLNESFFGMNFGINLTPGISDRWFIKRKLD